jgi:hypothetical protein
VRQDTSFPHCRSTVYLLTVSECLFLIDLGATDLAQVGIELDNKLFVRELVVDLIVFVRPASDMTL